MPEPRAPRLPRDPLTGVARVLRCTPGQLWTLLVLAAAGVALLIAVLPAVQHPPTDPASTPGPLSGPTTDGATP